MKIKEIAQTKNYITQNLKKKMKNLGFYFYFLNFYIILIIFIIL